MKTLAHFFRGNPCAVALGLLLIALALGSWRTPNFWLTPEQKGDRLMHEKKFAEAAKAYRQSWQIGAAQYRNGDFEAAAKTFARVPGASGAFDQGNAWLMHGAYDQAIASYDRALGFRKGWKDAEENKAVAIARRDKMKVDDKTREEEQAEAYKPDEIVFDQKGKDDKPPEKDDDKDPGDAGSDEALRAQWLRRVATTPGDFLKAKFAYQAGNAAPAKEGETP